MEEPGRLQSMGLWRVGHNWATSLTFHFHALEKEMATQSSVLAWRILGTAEPGGLPSMGSHRVGHDWSDLAAEKTRCFKLRNLALSTYGKMQESGFTEIIPFMCISAIWGQHPMFSTFGVRQCSSHGVAATWWLPDCAGILLPDCPEGSGNHIWRATITDDRDIRVCWYGRKILQFTLWHNDNSKDCHCSSLTLDL